MYSTTELRRMIIDIWGNNHFPDVSMSVIAHHILCAAFKRYPGLDTLECWRTAPSVSNEIVPDDYSLFTVTLSPILLDLLLDSNVLNDITKNISTVIMQWNDLLYVVWRGTLRLQFIIAYNENCRLVPVMPMLICMRKVENV
jgi:hypothetical protein